MKKPLFHLVDKTPVFRGDKLHVHPSYWRQAGAVVTAEFEGETRECGQVVVRSNNSAVPSLPFAALTRKPHPDVADCKAIALLLDCDVHEVSRRDLKLWRASREEAPAAPQAAPSSYINGADIRGNDDPIEVVRKLDAEYRRRVGER